MIIPAKLTKIVATISDKNCDENFIRNLFEAGMNVVRLNTAHQNFEQSLKVIELVRKVSDKIAILIDTKGPEIRTAASEVEIKLSTGDTLKVKGNHCGTSTADMLFVSYDGFVEDVAIGAKVMIDDGIIELGVIEKKDDYVICQARNAGVIKPRKSVNIPSAHIKLPSLSDKDRSFIEFAIEHDLDFIAHSFVRKKDDIIAVKEILDRHHSRIKIIAKIENQEGIDNIDEIIEHAYGVMVARGDLAVEVPQERIPVIQKKIIQKCIDARKPVITATQMMHSMIDNPRPTRAEISDVANAIFDGTDAVMLSGETAYGKYPVETVKTMAGIALEVERSKPLFIEMPAKILNSEVSAYLGKAAVKAAARLNAAAIVADTGSGRTIRNISGFRGIKPIMALCYNKKVMREMALSYGVYAEFMEPRRNTDEFMIHGLTLLTEKTYFKPDDRIVVLAGSFGRYQGASFIEISTAGQLIDRSKHLLQS